MLFTIFIIVAILLGLALVGLGINILFRKNGKFPKKKGFYLKKTKP